MPAAVGTRVGRPRRPQSTPGRSAPVVLVLPGAFTGPRLCWVGCRGLCTRPTTRGRESSGSPSPMAGDTHAQGHAPSGRLAAPPEGLTRGEQSGRSGKLSKQSGSTGQVDSVAMALVTKETSGGQGQNEGQTDTRRALTHGAGYKVDPGRLHLDVEPVAVGHEQPCGEKARGPGGIPCDGRPCFQTGPAASPPPRGQTPPALLGLHPLDTPKAAHLAPQYLAPGCPRSPGGRRAGHTGPAAKRSVGAPSGPWGAGGSRKRRVRGAARAQPSSPGSAPAGGPLRTFSWVAESEGPVATSTMMLFPL